MGKNTTKCIIGLLTVIAVVSIAIVYLVIHHHKPCKNGECVVKIDLGYLKGRERVSVLNNKTYYSFQGIPYAKPPLGPLRFKNPEPVEHWHNLIDATKESELCLQMFPSLLGKSIKGSEDCLYLNIYTTQFPDHDITLHPVMVYIHGGGFTTGGSNEDKYGADYLVEKGVVLITFNYRIGALGFLSLDNDDIPGNAGLKDQLAALKWIKQHISHFGGDPNNVLVFGNSAGSASIVYHMISPLSDGFFHKAILQSGTALNPWAFQQDPVQRAFRFGKILGINTTDHKELTNYLMNTPASDIVSLQENIITPEEMKNCFSFPFVPTIETQLSESTFLTDHPKKLLEENRFFHIPIIIGVVSNEGLLAIARSDFTNNLNEHFERFVPDDLQLYQNSYLFQNVTQSIEEFYFHSKKDKLTLQDLDNYMEICGDLEFVIGIEKTIEYLANSSSVYVYKFTHEGDYGEFKLLLQKEWPVFQLPAGPGHSDELGYLFSRTKSANFTEDTEENKMVEEMTDIWTSFATFETPNKNNEKLSWDTTKSDRTSFLEIGSTVKQIEGNLLSKQKHEFWNNIYNTVSNSVN
ncbi:esterase FE4-like [Lycorma delicatula]|uniref:esterase FE4-like n=1 Tax=Lycorma delicatula TaxID=130591 RepID=UPI003F517CF9